MLRSVFLLLSIILGIIFHEASVLSFLIQWLLAGMLFFSFLELRISFKDISAKHLIIAIGNVTLATAVYFILKPFNEWVALSSSIIALAPTAIAAPIMAKILKGDVTWVALSTIVTNMLVAGLLPFYIPYIYGIENHVNPLVLFKSLAIIFFIPFILAQLIQKYSPALLSFFSKFKSGTLTLFLINIFLASAKSTNYILFETTQPNEVIILISVFTGIMCVVNFGIGRLIAAKDKKIESSLAFGQKNTMFSVWIAITYINPLVSIAPMTYILFQNTYLSYLIFQENKSKNKIIIAN